MAGVHKHATVLGVTPKSLWNIERGIIGNRGRADLPGEPSFQQQFLESRQFCNGQRTFLRVVAACVEEDDQGRMSEEEFPERNRGAVMVFEDGRFNRFTTATGTRHPRKSATNACRQGTAHVCSMLSW